jgi:RNA polymerase sigma factor (sigma-70 family)
MAVVRTHDRETSNELVQDVLVAVIGALRKGHLRDPQKLAAFVHGTARNLINNHLRVGSQQPQLEPLPENLIHADHVEQLEQAERSRMVLQALEHLSREDRQILWMTLVEGHKPGEISTALGLKSDVVRARKVRALRKVTELIRKKLSRNAYISPHS